MHFRICVYACYYCCCGADVDPWLLCCSCSYRGITLTLVVHLSESAVSVVLAVCFFSDSTVVHSIIQSSCQNMCQTVAQQPEVTKYDVRESQRFKLKEYSVYFFPTLLSIINIFNKTNFLNN